MFITCWPHCFHAFESSLRTIGQQVHYGMNWSTTAGRQTVGTKAWDRSIAYHLSWELDSWLHGCPCFRFLFYCYILPHLHTFRNAYICVRSSRRVMLPYTLHHTLWLSIWPACTEHNIIQQYTTRSGLYTAKEAVPKHYTSSNGCLAMPQLWHLKHNVLSKCTQVPHHAKHGHQVWVHQGGIFE